MGRAQLKLIKTAVPRSAGARSASPPPLPAAAPPRPPPYLPPSQAFHPARAAPGRPSRRRGPGNSRGRAASRRAARRLAGGPGGGSRMSIDRPGVCLLLDTARGECRVSIGPQPGLAMWSRARRCFHWPGGISPGRLPMLGLCRRFSGKRRKTVASVTIQPMRPRQGGVHAVPDASGMWALAHPALPPSIAQVFT